MKPTQPTLGVIIGNRDFFPDQLVAEAREDILKLCKERGIKPIMVSPEDTKLGGVETHAEARKCADLFRKHRDEIDGVLVALPNFGDEKGVADALKLAVFVGILAWVGNLARLGVLPRTRPIVPGELAVSD